MMTEKRDKSGVTELEMYMIALNIFKFLLLLGCFLWMCSLVKDSNIICELQPSRVYNYSYPKTTVECDNVIRNYTRRVPWFLCAFGIFHGVIILMLIYLTRNTDKTEKTKKFQLAVWIITLSLYLGASFHIYNNILHFGQEDSLYWGAIPFYVSCNISHDIDQTKEEICVLRYPTNIKKTLLFAPIVSIVLIVIYFARAVKILFELLTRSS